MEELAGSVVGGEFRDALELGVGGGTESLDGGFTCGKESREEVSKDGKGGKER